MSSKTRYLFLTGLFVFVWLLIFGIFEYFGVDNKQVYSLVGAIIVAIMYRVCDIVDEINFKSKLKQATDKMKTFYNFQTEDHLQVPLKNVNRPCIDIEGYCQNRMPNGRCTSFVCTKIVRFK